MCSDLNTSEKRKIDNLTEKSDSRQIPIFSRFLVALCIINYVYPYCHKR